MTWNSCIAARTAARVSTAVLVAAACFVPLHAQAQPRAASDYLFLAQKTIHIASGATINGNVGVQSDRGSVKVGLESTMANDTVLVASKVKLAGLSTAFDVYADRLKFKPADTTVNGTIVTPIPAPIYDTEPLVVPDPFDSANYPAVWPVTCGLIDREVLPGESLTLSPGQHGRVTVRPGGELSFAPGVYELCELRIMGSADASGPVEIHVRDRFSMTAGSAFQPAGAASPEDIQVNLEGKKSIKIGDDAIVSFHLYAPKATLKIRAGVVMNGRFLSRKLGCSSRFTATATPASVVPPYCGDGTLNVPGETCEPPGGVQANGNQCRGDCTYCGDGNVDAGEQCDDGNTDDGDACSNSCVLNSVCGDGVVNAPGETCEPPGSTQANGNQCRGDCTYCGDGNVDGGEQCDDANTNDDDGCRNNCTIPSSPAIDICKQEEGPDVRYVSHGGSSTDLPITNGGFENPTVGTCGVQSLSTIPGWTTTNTNQYTFLGVRSGASGCSLEAPEGNQALKITEATIEQQVGVVTEAVVCDLSFWVRRATSSTTEWVKVFAGSTELIEIGPGSSPGSWLERSGTFSIPASLIGEPIRIEIDQWASSSSDYSYYDDIQLSCGNSSPPIVEFDIKVENTGDVPLTGVEVDDPLVADCDRVIGDLAVGATETYTCSVTLGVDSMTWLDEFGSASYGNDDGDAHFSGPWVEVDGQGGGATGGNVFVGGGRLKLDDNPDTGGHPSATRSADLSGKDIAVLSFDYLTTSGVDSSDSAAVQVSSDGVSFTTLEEFTGISGSTAGTRSYDISSFISSQTTVRFVILANYGASDEYFKVDDVSIVGTGLGELVNEACASGTGAGSPVSDCDTSTVIVSP